MCSAEQQILVWILLNTVMDLYHAMFSSEISLLSIYKIIDMKTKWSALLQRRILIGTKSINIIRGRIEELKGWMSLG